MRSQTGNANVVTATVLATGEEFGGYQIVDRRGFTTTDIDPRGFSMAAELYSAVEVWSERPVVLKVFRRRHTGEEPFAKRFLRDGKQVASFEHPNIVSIYDTGLERGYLFLAMEIVSGDTLLDRIRARGVSAEQTLALLAPVADAVDAAHVVGLVHGDIRPQTILIDAGGVPHLAAFDVVKSPREMSIAGVPSRGVNYASPEQLCSQGLTGATDVYSLTAVLYHCLTGEVLYPEEIAQAHFEGLELDSVIARGMAKDPAHRYAQARALIAAAAEALSELPVETLRSAPTFVSTGHNGHSESGLATDAAAAAATAPRVDRGAGRSRRADRRAPRSRRVDRGASRSRRAGISRLVVALGLIAVAVAVVGVMALGGGSAAGTSKTASSSSLTVRYERPWQVASDAVPGGFALASGGSAPAPIALASGSATLAAGSLGQSAVVPGGAPPELVQRYGHPVSATTASVAGHAASRYEWMLAGGGQLVGLVLPTAGSDLALMCSGSTAGAAALASCERLAGAAEVSGVTVVAPGPDARLAAALSRALGRVAVARVGLRGLGAGSLPARAEAARSVAALERSGLSMLAGLTVLARNRQAVGGLVGALGAEEASFAALAAAAAENNRVGYAAARLRVLAASKLLAPAAAALVAQGFQLPSLPGLFLSAAPARPARKPASKPAPRSAAPPPVVSAPATSTTQSTQAASPTQSYSPPPVSQPSQPSSPPPVSQPSQPSSPQPSSPTTVVVPTGSGGTTQSSSPSSTVVTVPGG